MPFEYDLFISYSHRDNGGGRGEGWVDRFHELLRERLSVQLGREPRIWRDVKQLDGGDYFDDEIAGGVRRSKALLVIVSPSYLRSEYCAQELDCFTQAAEANGGERVGNRGRRLKVVKTWVERDQHPAALRKQTGYELCEKDPESGRPREFSQIPSGYKHQEYLDKMEDLVWYLTELLNEMDRMKPQPGPQLVSPGEKPAVYLAAATSDRAEDRKRIANELRARQYPVLPDDERAGDLLLLSANEVTSLVQNYLVRARLAVHLIGETYGGFPEGEEERSLIHLQNDLAAGRSREAGLERLIWLPPGLAARGKRQQEFIESLRTDGEAQRGAEVLERSFEDLKTRILEKLTAPPTAPAKLPLGPRDLVRVYLICDKLDFTSVPPVTDYLFGKRYEVIESAREGEDAQVLQYHKENLLECDAVLIYYGGGNEFWLRSKLWDLKKVAGWGRTAPLLVKAVFLAQPETDHKRRFRTLEAELLPAAYNGQFESSLERFIDLVEGARQSLAPTGSGGA